MLVIDVPSREVVHLGPGGEPRARFPALSAYVCPGCGEPLKAAFLIPSPLGQPSLDGAGHRYRMSHAAGTQLVAATRESAPCRYVAYAAAFLRESLSDLVFEQTGHRLTPDAIDGARAARAISGDALRLVADAVGGGEPIVVFDPVAFRSMLPDIAPRALALNALLAAIGLDRR